MTDKNYVVIQESSPGVFNTKPSLDSFENPNALFTKESAEAYHTRRAIMHKDKAFNYFLEYANLSGAGLQLDPTESAEDPANQHLYCTFFMEDKDEYVAKYNHTVNMLFAQRSLGNVPIIADINIGGMNIAFGNKSVTGDLYNSVESSGMLVLSGYFRDMNNANHPVNSTETAEKITKIGAAFNVWRNQIIHGIKDAPIPTTFEEIKAFSSKCFKLYVDFAAYADPNFNDWLTEKGVL